MKYFVTIFDRAKNFHLVKDVGQVPYHMHKEFGYNSTLITCKNDLEYQYLDDEVKGLKINFIPKIKLFKINLGVVLYLIKNAKKIDVLQQFHIRNYTLFYAFIYKIFNKKGINYIKADANEKYLMDRGFVLKKKYLKSINNNIDLLSFETSKIVNLCLNENPNLRTRVFKISNGIDDRYINEKLNLNKFNPRVKENIILHVTRAGDYAKNTELFLNAIEKVNLKDWKIYILGSIEKSFLDNIDFFYNKNNSLKDKVIFLGNVTSRKKLFDYYNKSKVLCLSSRIEGFPLVFCESIYFGNYIFTTDVSGAEEITRNSKYGTIVRSLDSNIYANELQKLIDSDILKDYKTFENNKIYGEVNFTWQNILKVLEKYIRNCND